MFNLTQQVHQPHRPHGSVPVTDFQPVLARPEAMPVRQLSTVTAHFLRLRKKINRFRYLTRGIVMLKEAVDRPAIRFNYPPIIPTESHYREIKVCNLFFDGRPRADLEERLGSRIRRFS
jgi:hypothetical protein